MQPSIFRTLASLPRINTVEGFLLDEWHVPSPEYLQALEDLMLVYSTAPPYYPHALIMSVYLANRDLLNEKFIPVHPLDKPPQ